jgi:hypothetical protein
MNEDDVPDWWHQQTLEEEEYNERREFEDWLDKIDAQTYELDYFEYQAFINNNGRKDGQHRDGIEKALSRKQDSLA